MLHQLIQEASEGVSVVDATQMAQLTHAIEETIARQRLPVDLYVGFQRFSCIAPQTERYRRLAAVCRSISLWGVPDARPEVAPGVRLNPLAADHPLARAWFVVVDSPHFFTALLTREQDDGAGAGRRFSGAWSHDGGLVTRAVAALADAAGLAAPAAHQRDYEAQSRNLGQLTASLARAREGSAQLLSWHEGALARSALAASDTPLLVLDSARALLAASPAAAALLGATPAELVGRPLAACAGGIFAQRDPTRTPAPQMALIVAQPGRLLATTSAAIVDEGGRTIGWVVRLYEGPAAQLERAGLAALLQRYAEPIRAGLRAHPTADAVAGPVRELLGELERALSDGAAWVASAAPAVAVRSIGSYLQEMAGVSEAQIRAALVVQRQRRARRRPLPLGEILIQQGVIDAPALGRALAAQTADALRDAAHPLGRRLGARLLRANAVSAAQLAQALATQIEQRAQGRAARLGAILVAQGALAEEALRAALDDERTNA